jgi:hypothetical protein
VTKYRKAMSIPSSRQRRDWSAVAAKERVAEPDEDADEQKPLQASAEPDENSDSENSDAENNGHHANGHGEL